MNEETLSYLINLKYGNLSIDDYETLKDQDNVFHKFANMFKNEPYPLPESTKNEIDQLIKIQNTNMNDSNWKEIEGVIVLCDSDPLGVIRELCTDLKVEYKDQYISKVSERLGSFIMELKSHYQRPRPYQVSLYTNQDFHSQPTISGHSPAYPSGHTIQAYMVCKIIAFHNPEKEKEIMEIAKVVSDSREILGVHYPSDNLFSRYIVDELCEIKEIKDIYFNPKKLKSTNDSKAK